MTAGRSALIIATGEYDNEGLRRLAAPQADAIALAGVLGDPAIGNFAVEVVSDESSWMIQERIEDFLIAGRPDDVLLVHFSCHGLKNDLGELFFAARNTRPGRLESTAIPAGFVQRCLRNCRAGSVVLLLDCCFGGAFPSVFTARAGEDVHVRDSFPDMSSDGRGRAIITATGATQYAFEGDQLAGTELPGPSVFTRVLVEGLATGDADRDGDGLISFSDLYRYVYGNVTARNPRQTPQRIGDVEGDLYVAYANVRHALPEDLAAGLRSSYPAVQIVVVDELGRWLSGDDLVRAETAWHKLHQVSDTSDPAVAAAARGYLTGPPPRIARLLTEAESAARSITDGDCRAIVQTIIAEAVAATDPPRAEKIARSITDGYEEVRALSAVARAAAARDDIAAWRIAGSIRTDYVKAQALSAVAAAAATDPARAARYLAEAEGIASSITAEWDHAQALLGIAKEVAATDPDHAEVLARSITYEGTKAQALCEVATVVSATDSARADRLLAESEGIAWSLDSVSQALALRNLAEARAAKDPDHAIRLLAGAQKAEWALVPQEGKIPVLGGIAVTDPDRAEEIARSLSDEVEQAWALSLVAEAVAATDPLRAERITGSLTGELKMVTAMLRAAKTVRGRELYCAQRLAEYAAQSTASGDGQGGELTRFGDALTAADLVEAERIARSVSEPEPRTWALLLVVVALANASGPG